MVSASVVDRGFYAVRPELVLRAAAVFAISSSMLEKGAKRLHSRAVAIQAGKEAGRWGRHQRSVIVQYCEYTQAGGSEYLLPWQELVEHRSRYDGQEGISSRTGNKPLSTITRVSVNASAMQRARTMSGISIAELSERSQLPPALLQAMESGDWPDVAESTAEAVAVCLNTTPGELFAPLEALRANAETAPLSGGTPRLRSVILAGVFLAALAAVGLIASKTQTGAEFDTEFVGTQWRVSIVRENQNIVLPAQTLELFANGGYLEFKDDGVLAFNWVNPGFLAVLPENFDWRLTDRLLRVKLNDVIYEFSLGGDGEKLVALDSTRSYKMTMQRIGASAIAVVTNPADTAYASSLSSTGPDALVGCWRWSNGMRIVVSGNGTANNGFGTGPWSAVAAGEYVIDWPDIVGNITLAVNGQSLSSFDSLGTASTAQRLEGNAGQIVGTWQWDNGGVVTMSANGSMSLGPFRGAWKRAQPGYKFSWPIVDTIAVSKDGQHLSGENQFGAFHATRLASCY